VRFAITPLGSAGGRTVGQVVDAIVRYLEPRRIEHSGAAPQVPSGDGPSSYYADRGSEPGRWLGVSAGEAGLAGDVDPQVFARVLAGRDPTTGDRLITAQGSAGRRPTLGVGTETCRAADSTPLYAAADAAAALSMTGSELDALVVAGQRIAIAGLASQHRGASAPVEPAGSYVVPVIDENGEIWIAEHELLRCEMARSRGPLPQEVAAGGGADDLLTLPEASRLAGLTPRYLRGLCARYDDQRAEIIAAVDAGRPPRRAYLVAYRGAKRQWLVKRADLVAFLGRRAAPAVRVGYDLTLTTEKSLGVLALLGDDRVRRCVLDAIQAGNDTGLAYLELRAGGARSRGRQVFVRGLTIASFRHLTSRALDPFPHHHNVIANTVVDENGTRRALDARGLYLHAQTASALATAQMRHQLTETLGVRWRPGRSGGWEIEGISDEVVREFSRRRAEIEDAVAELEAAIGRTKTVGELQSLVLATRPAKQDVDPSQLVDGWWQRAATHGLTPHELRACTGRARANAITVDDRVIFDALASPASGLCAHSSIFTRADVVAAVVELAVDDGSGDVQPLLLPARETEHLADRFLASSQVVALDASRLWSGSALAHQELFTTNEMLAVQRRVLAAYGAGTRAGIAQVPADSLVSALDGHPTLTGEQRDLVGSFCASGYRVQCAVGRAGAGKTTTMRAAAAAWNARGYRVVGAAVKGEATRHLAEGAGIEAETVAWYLARRRSDAVPLDAKTVLIVDEASTLSDRDLLALIEMATDAGAAVRLIGDPDQHGAVTAGGMFRHLCELDPVNTPELATSHRVTDAADRYAAAALRQGRAQDALDALEAAGHLHIADGDLDLYVGMLRRWWHSRQAGDHHPMVDRRHKTRRQLNRLARQLLRANDQLGATEIESSGGRHFAVGDRVVARKVARHLHVDGDATSYLRNGAHGSVTEVCCGATPAGDRLTVNFDGVGSIIIPRSFFDEHAGPGGRIDVGVDHAYAVTSYAVQGATFAASTSRIDEGASRSEVYVDITRGRTSNHLFLTRSDDPLDGEHLPKVPPPPLAESISERLRRSGPERAAVEFAPSPDTPPRRRVDVSDAPESLLRRLPRPVDGPIHLRRMWEDAITSVLAYRTMASPGPGHGPWAWAVGGSRIGPVDPEREAVVEQITAYVVAVASERLRWAAGTELPQWLQRRLIASASHGRCDHDWTAVAHLSGGVEQYRALAGITSVTDALDDPPDSPVLAAQRAQLAAELAALDGRAPSRGVDRQ